MRYAHHNGQRRKIDRLVKHFIERDDNLADSSELFDIAMSITDLLHCIPRDDQAWNVHKKVWRLADDRAERQEQDWLIHQTY